MDSSNFREYSVATDVLSPGEQAQIQRLSHNLSVALCVNKGPKPDFRISKTPIVSSSNLAQLVYCKLSFIPVIPFSSTERMLSLQRESFATVIASSSMELLPASCFSAASLLLGFATRSSLFSCLPWSEETRDVLWWLLESAPLRLRRTICMYKQR